MFSLREKEKSVLVLRSQLLHSTTNSAKTGCEVVDKVLSEADIDIVRRKQIFLYIRNSNFGFRLELFFCIEFCMCLTKLKA